MPASPHRAPPPTPFPRRVSHAQLSASLHHLGHGPSHRTAASPHHPNQPLWRAVQCQPVPFPGTLCPWLTQHSTSSASEALKEPLLPALQGPHPTWAHSLGISYICVPPPMASPQMCTTWNCNGCPCTLASVGLPTSCGAPPSVMYQAQLASLPSASPTVCLAGQGPCLPGASQWAHCQASPSPPL